MPKEEAKKRAGPYVRDEDIEHYCCTECGATHVKLWREYQVFNAKRLLCAPCMCQEGECDLQELDEDGTRMRHDGLRTDAIGWYIPAVPTEDGSMYWGYTSVPDEAYTWWRDLPLLPPVQNPS